jgi:glycosyltransferase involved in cell wall biosynthesis
MLTLAAEFARRGYRIDVVVPRPDGPFRAAVPPAAHLVVVKSPAERVAWLRRHKGLSVLASAPALARYLRHAAPDVLLSSSNPANLAALLARRLAGARTPVVITVNVHVSRAVAGRGGATRLFLAGAIGSQYPRADAIIAGSRCVADDLAGVAGMVRDRITVIHNPIAAAEIWRQAQAPVDHPWLGPDEPPVVLGVGKLKAQKDFPTLMRAFALLHARRPARLLILGEGERRNALAALVRKLGIAGDVGLPGFVVNPFSYMARAGVFALSSAWEGFSNVLAEALACGCPVVSTDCPGGAAEILDGGAYGALVPVGDAEALAAALGAALDAPPPRDRLQARARAFTAESATEKYLAVVRACTEDRG